MAPLPEERVPTSIRRSLVERLELIKDFFGTDQLELEVVVDTALEAFIDGIVEDLGEFHLEEESPYGEY